MIRRRFAGLRPVRIVSWTAVAVGWVTAIIARGAIAGPEDSVTGVEPPEPPARTVFFPAAETDPVPVLPARGLVVIRHTPDPRPDPKPVVQRVVVQKVVPAPAAPARSSGS